jgi:PST family polysaccharide transporter
VFDPIDIFYQAKVLSKGVIKARASAFLIFILVRIGLILGGFSVVWFAVAGTMELALATALMVWIYHRKEGGFREWVWEKNTAKMLLKDGWPLIASSLLIIVHTRLDQVMIGQMLNDVQVGHYSAAVRISEAWLFVPVLVVQTVMPYFVRLREQSPTRYQQRLMQLYSAMFWSGALAGVMAILFGRQVIEVLFGAQYSNAYGSLVLLIWTGIFIAQAVARGIWMISENLQVFRLLNNLIAVPINIGLNLLWIPKYGVSGAAAASLISVCLGTWVAPLLFEPLRKSNLDMIRSIDPRHLVVRA